MKRTALLCLLLITCLTGCSAAQVKVDPSYFTAAYASIGSAAGSFVLPEAADVIFDSQKFLYQDICFASENVIPEGSYDFSAVSAACFDIDDAGIIYAKDIFKKVYPASVTKLLTALIAIRHTDPDELVRISEDNCGITTPGAKLCGFKKGDTVTMRDLLYCLLIYSGNDAAIAIAEYVSGSVDEFCKLMNKEAAVIGATGTHFTNPHGLQDVNHYTTAYDIYLIFNECLKYPILNDIFSCKQYTAVINRANGEQFSYELEPTSYYAQGLTEAPAGMTVIGGKTGETVAAKNCLVILSVRDDGHRFITELFKATDRNTVYKEMNMLLEMCVEAQ